MEDNNTIYLYNDRIGKVQLVDSMGSDLSVVNAARVSFGNNKTELDEKDIKLIKYLIQHKHTSTLEHCTLTYKFVVPLFVRSQHHRHRTWSYNEISRRYTAENFQFYEPDMFRTQHKSNRQASNAEELIDPKISLAKYEETGEAYALKASELVREHHINSLMLYNELLANGVCREQARGVLPQNMYTEYYGTVNLNNLLKFVDSRTHEGAQWEIVQPARACLKLAEQKFPVTIAAYREINKVSW